MSFGIKELIVILVIVMLVFGTKKIRGVGTDVGGWIRDFKKALKEGEQNTDDVAETNNVGRVIDAESSSVKKENA
ncbi:MAG: twin-arginine translocase TatA/TatE family subunit [Proteobacteria bacterium]|nr:twin-arginine translocase TatA/TatE family subunit [Pseudomonadota bacterium]